VGKRKTNPATSETDLLIIGGGITGAGAARDAARRGVRVVVVEQGDIASGTSSRSSKLVHGGLRYLEQGEVSLVFEAVAERRILLEIAPHLVHPMPFLLPVFGDSRVGMFTINIGMWLYDGLSLFRSPRVHKTLSRAKVLKAEPTLRSEGLKGAPVYYDCATDDARLTLETLLDAERHGAEIRTHTRVTRLLREGTNVVAAEVRDQLTGEVSTINAKAIVNATGPWSDHTRSLDGTVPNPRMRPTKGIHIVVSAKRLPITHAVVCLHPTDGRVFFTIPWGDETYIGTTDTDFEGDPGAVNANAEDVAYLIAATNEYFPGTSINADDVIATWAGVRPLVSQEATDAESSVSREHIITVEADGLITIAGGKLTTYRRMGTELINRVLETLDDRGLGLAGLQMPETDLNPLPGAVGWPESGDCDAVAERILAASDGSLTQQTVDLLSKSYGMRGINIAEMVVADPTLAAPLIEGRPEIAAQVVWAATEELAATISDVMIRRTQLYYRDLNQGLDAVDLVAKLLTEQLGWTSKEAATHAADYLAEVERSRSWRTE